MRRPLEQDLGAAKSPDRDHAIAGHHANEDAQATIKWSSRRGDASQMQSKEPQSQELKIGSRMDSMADGLFPANAHFFAIGAPPSKSLSCWIALDLGFRAPALAGGGERLRSVCRRLVRTAGKIIRQGRRMVAKISAGAKSLLRAARRPRSHGGHGRRDLCVARGSSGKDMRQGHAARRRHS